MSILEKLQMLEKSNIYPFHMPGHKRNVKAMNSVNSDFPYGIDITEIDGFDDLHEAEGIIKEAQEKAALYYGSKKAFYLVNGSTCGILTAISAAVPMGQTVLVARNCHKAVYHALQLRNAKAVYLYPEYDEFGIAKGITKEIVEQGIAEAKGEKIAACILTSPTYEGVVSEIRCIAEVLHKHQIPLIVDEAHGAHFGFSTEFPENATTLGADAVVVSIHKTMPCPTQTALLHLCSDMISEESIRLFLNVYETSSPSYVLMAAMEEGLDFAKNNIDLWNSYTIRLQQFYEQANTLTYLTVPKYDDFGKIVVVGNNLASQLRERFGIEVEMETTHYVILMTSLLDTEEGLVRLIQALQKLDCIENQIKIQPSYLYPKAICSEFTIGGAVEKQLNQQVEKKDLWEATNSISAEYIYLYPPGVPVIAPGEIITDEVIALLKESKAKGLSIKGLANTEMVRII